jgi:hypothetical protein
MASGRLAPMSRKGRNSILLLVVGVLVTSLSLSVLAASEGEEGGDTAGDGGSTTTTIASGLHPTVEVGGDEVAAEQADWTYRYMIPTAIALAVLIVLLTAVKYFTDVVRRRYRIVKE